MTCRASGLTGKPAFFSWARVSVCVGAGHMTSPLTLRRGAPSHHAEGVGPEVQRPLGRDGRVLLAQRAGGGVARIDEEPLAQLGLALVHGLELLDGHVDLAADLEHVGIGAARLGQLLRHVGDGADVRRHVLAGDAVAAGGRLHERAPLVGQRHGHAVDLGLAREGERLEVEVGRLAAQPLAPGPQLVLAERVVEAHHRDAVAHLLEQARRRRAHGVRRRVGCRQRGIVRLELPQLDHEEVVFGVGDLGRIEHVVQLVVVDDLLPELGGPVRRLLRDAAVSVPVPATVRRRCPRPRRRRGRARRRAPPSGPAPRGAAGRRRGPRRSVVGCQQHGARHGAPVRADLRHGPGTRGQRLVDPRQRRPRQQHRRAQHLRRAPDGHPPRRHVDVRHVAPLAVAAVAHAAALAHRDELDRLDGAGRAALAVHHLGGVQLHPPGQEPLTALGAPDEAHVLAVRLARGAQPETAGVGPHLVLGHVAHGEDDAGQRVLAEHGQHVGLVLEGVGATAELPRRVGVGGGDPGVVARGQAVEAEAVGPVQQAVELHGPVALDARVGRPPQRVLPHVGRHDRCGRTPRSG